MASKNHSWVVTARRAGKIVAQIKVFWGAELYLKNLVGSQAFVSDANMVTRIREYILGFECVAANASESDVACK